MGFVGGGERVDGDAIRPEHMVEFWKAWGGGQRDAGIDGSRRPANQLAILPDTTHCTIPVELVTRRLRAPWVAGTGSQLALG